MRPPCVVPDAPRLTGDKRAVQRLIQEDALSIHRTRNAAGFQGPTACGSQRGSCEVAARRRTARWGAAGWSPAGPVLAVRTVKGGGMSAPW